MQIKDQDQCQDHNISKCMSVPSSYLIDCWLMLLDSLKGNVTVKHCSSFNKCPSFATKHSDRQISTDETLSFGTVLLVLMAAFSLDQPAPRPTSGQPVTRPPADHTPTAFRRGEHRWKFPATDELQMGKGRENYTYVLLTLVMRRIRD